MTPEQYQSFPPDPERDERLALRPVLFRPKDYVGLSSEQKDDIIAWQSGRIEDQETEAAILHDEIIAATSELARFAIEKEDDKEALMAARMAVRELEARVNTDPLTGIGNRSVFEEALKDRPLYYEGEERREAHPEENRALLIIDLDHFKEVNDQLGHPAGDQLLVAFAQKLVETLRQEDSVFCRFGGDEFAVLLRGVRTRYQLRGAIARIEAIGDELAEEDSKLRNVKFGVTCAGIMIDETLDDPQQIYDAADAALLRRKKRRKGGEQKGITKN